MLKELKNNFPDIIIKENADMSELCSFKAGGNARYLVIPRTIKELKAVLSIISKNAIPHIILGNGTNTLFRDGTYEGVVIKLDENAFGTAEIVSDKRECENISGGVKGETTNTMSKCVSKEDERETIEICAGAAMLLSSLSKLSFSLSAEGMEGLSGIPGSVGGAAFMNAGAYDSETKNVVKSVHAVSPDGSTERDFTNEEMGFGYRHSSLMENGYIVTSVTFLLKKGERSEIEERFREFTKKRTEKQPLEFPSAGSTFKRPVGYFAGKLIQDAGLKGLSVGGAQVSALHSGFIINKGGATATDILKLMTLIQNTVFDTFGVKLEPEVRII